MELKENAHSIHPIETEETCRILFIFFFQVRGKTNTPLQIQTEIYSAAQNKSSPEWTRLPPRDQLSSFMSI